MPAAPKLKLSERGRVERICGEAIASCDGVDFFQSTFVAFVLRDGDGTVESDNREGRNVINVS
jgi:hypothetical protein